MNPTYKTINNSFCNCTHCSSLTAINDTFGYWDVCCDCGKPLEDGFHPYNHYDGEDHDDVSLGFY